MTPQQTNERPEANLTDDETALYEAMSEISEDCWCAGWMHGNEYSLWSALQDGELKYGMGFMDKPLLAKVAALSVQTGKWIVWRDDDSLPLDQHGPYAIDLSKWSAIYDGKNDLRHAPAPTGPVLIGAEVSMDVSTGDADAEHRIYGRVEEVMTGAGGEVVLLAVEQSRNFSAEPAVDRDAVLEEAAMACEAWGDAKVIKWQDSPDMLEDAKARAWDGLQCAHAVRALKLATPASPAVPEPIEQAFTDALMGGLGVVRIDPSTMFEPQVAQASQPTSAGEFPGVNIDRAHHIMDGYTPKPPPPRPQRPPGPLWTDAERQRFRENMKRGERCPICSVIEGGQHFPGCSRGTP